MEQHSILGPALYWGVFIFHACSSTQDHFLSLAWCSSCPCNNPIIEVDIINSIPWIWKLSLQEMKWLYVAKSITSWFWYLATCSHSYISQIIRVPVSQSRRQNPSCPFCCGGVAFFQSIFTHVFSVNHFSSLIPWISNSIKNYHPCFMDLKPRDQRMWLARSTPAGL